MRGFEAPKDRLAIALDVPDLHSERALLDRLGGVAGWHKVGLELFSAAGPAAVEMAGADARVFLDLKFHDIPNTVAGAVASATRAGVSMLTLHAGGGRDMLCAARDAAESAAAAAGVERPRLVAVTVLTSLSEAALHEVGVATHGVAEQVERLASLVADSGLDGVVASALEVRGVRKRIGPERCIVTPGIRPAHTRVDDQVRVASPSEAIASGADLLVVGRPVRGDSDPAQAARKLIADIEHAIAG
ncbi:orotidine-5'-phosphate decarboxylase [Myxococcota bacterium]|nr:orotidine-5'-phosphate decarboxylase [Myxococcota bacterium]